MNGLSLNKSIPQACRNARDSLAGSSTTTTAAAARFAPTTVSLAAMSFASTATSAFATSEHFD